MFKEEKQLLQTKRNEQTRLDNNTKNNDASLA